jgi:cytochrome c oxidase assembly protein subunit 15
MLAFLHRVGALAAVLATLRAALLAAVPATRRYAALLVAGVCVQCALGLATAAGSVPLGVATAHNMVAAALVALLAGLARRASARGD